MIARAETKTAQNLSSVETYDETDTVTGLLCFDARIGTKHDQACLDRAGKTFSKKDAKNERLTHPNCSLSWAPVVAQTLADLLEAEGDA
jgi:hypothetical protein